MNVTVRNVITSMRLMSAFDWEEFFESVSLVDAVLRAGHRFAAGLPDPRSLPPRDRGAGARLGPHRARSRRALRGGGWRRRRAGATDAAPRRRPRLLPDRPTAAPGSSASSATAFRSPPAARRATRGRDALLFRHVRAPHGAVLALPLVVARAGAGPLALLLFALLGAGARHRPRDRAGQSRRADPLGPRPLPRLELRGRRAGRAAHAGRRPRAA